MEIHKKKIDDDQFVQRSGQFLSTYVPLLQQNKDAVLRAAAVIAGLLVIIAIFFGWQQSSYEESNNLLDDALRAANALSENAEDIEKQQDPAVAIEKFENFLKHHPTGEKAAWAHYYLASIQLKNGKTEDAIKHYQAFLAQAPKESEAIAKKALAYAFLKAGKKNEAMQEFEGLRGKSWSPELLEFETSLAKLENDKNAAIDSLKKLAASSTTWGGKAKEQLKLLSPELTPSLLIQSIPEPSPTNTPVPTETPTNTPVPTETLTPTETPTETLTPTETPVPTETLTPTETLIPTETPASFDSQQTEQPSPTNTAPELENLPQQEILQQPTSAISTQESSEATPTPETASQNPTPTGEASFAPTPTNVPASDGLSGSIAPTATPTQEIQ